MVSVVFAGGREMKIFSIVFLGSGFAILDGAGNYWKK